MSTTLSMLTIVFSLSVLDSAGETEEERSRDDDDESGDSARRRRPGSGGDATWLLAVTVAGQATATTMIAMAVGMITDSLTHWLFSSSSSWWLSVCVWGDNTKVVTKHTHTPRDHVLIWSYVRGGVQTGYYGTIGISPQCLYYPFVQAIWWRYRFMPIGCCWFCWFLRALLEMIHWIFKLKKPTNY